MKNKQRQVQRAYKVVSERLIRQMGKRRFKRAESILRSVQAETGETWTGMAVALDDVARVFTATVRQAARGTGIKP